MSTSPLPGVNVVVKGTTIGTTTDAEGAYELGVPSLQDTLVFSFVGYQNKEVAIAGRSVVDVEMATGVLKTEELVVVGYGEQEEGSISSAVTQVSGTEITEKNTADTRQALQGIAPGVLIIDSGGEPGRQGVDIRIRGNTTIGNTYPLILVNGIEQDFSDLNPHNIESISVLKDASAAAIYGSRAANGVVLVQTKEPVAGAFQVSYDGYYGIDRLSQEPDQLDTESYMRLRNEAMMNLPGGGEPEFTEEEIQEHLNSDDPLRHPPHNAFWGALFSPGPRQNHSLAFSGGSDQIRARLALNYFDQEGIIPNFRETRKQVRLNAAFDVSDNISLDGNLMYRRKDNLRPFDIGGIYFELWHLGGGFTVPKYPDGTYGIGPRGTNPLLSAEISGERNHSDDYFLANFQGEVELLDNLSFSSQFGGHTNFATNSNFGNEYVIRDYYTDAVTRTSGFNRLNEYRARNQRWTWRSLLNYDLALGKNQIELLSGYEQTWDRFQNVNAFRNQFYNNSLRALRAGSRENSDNYGDVTEERLRSVFGRARYVYAGKYILEASARYDGSSKFFGADNQYAFFPAISGAWRVSQEGFWEALKPGISNLKLRASWGKTGNNTVGLYTFFEGINVGTNYVFGGDLVRTASSAGLVNRDLTWETTTEWDVGLDAEFLEGRFGLTFDYYQKRTEGILLTLPIPDVVGLNAPPQNAGRVDNTGWELGLTHQNAVGEDFSYSVKANLSDFTNEVVDLAQTGPYFPYLTVTKVGESLNALWGYKALGLFQSEEEIANYPTWAGKDNTFPGDIKYADLNGDGELTPADRTVIGNLDPHYSFGISTNMQYKSFDFSFFVQGVGQQDRMTTGAARECGNWGSLTLELCEDYWTPQNTDARIPRPQNRSRKNTTGAVNSSWWVIDASYVKLKNLQLGYTLPSGLTSRFGADQLRIYVSGRDLLTFSEATKWGLDPEFRPGRLNYYPQTSSYSVGVNLQF